MNKNLKVLATTTALSLLLSTNVFAHEGEIEVGDTNNSNQPFRVVMQGREINSDVPSIESNHKIYIPLRSVMDQYGASLKWDKESRTIILNKDGLNPNKNIVPKENHANIRINLNGKNITPEDLMIENGRTMVPASFIGMMADMDVHQVDYTKSIFIDGNQSISEKDLPQMAFMPNGQGNSVSAVNLQTGQVLDVISDETIPGATNSHGLAINNDGSRIYVSSMNKDFVTVYDTKQQKTLDNINVGFTTHHMDIDPLGRYVYVTEYKGNKVAIIDTKTNQLIQTIVTGKGAYMPTPSLDGKTLYVANKMDNNIVFIDLDNMKITQKVQVGLGPDHMAVDPDTGDIYVTNGNSNTISIVSSDGKSTQEVKSGTEPHGIDVVNGKILVSNASSNDLTIVDRTTLKTSSMILGEQLGHLKVTPDRSEVLVQVEGSQEMLILDAKTLKIKKRIDLLSDGHQIGIPSF